MKKEVFIAIIIGFTLGLVITFGVHSAQQSLKQKKSASNSPSLAPTSSPQKPLSHIVTVSSPEEGSLLTSKSATITGTTTANALLAVISGNAYSTTSADDQGNFSATLEVSEGANLITIKSYHPNGEASQKELTLIYLPPTQELATPSAKITEKISPTPKL